MRADQFTEDTLCICCWFSQRVNPDPVFMLDEDILLFEESTHSLQAGNDKLGNGPQS